MPDRDLDLFITLPLFHLGVLSIHGAVTGVADRDSVELNIFRQIDVVAAV